MTTLFLGESESRGFTLVELLAVLAIITLIGGLSAGVFQIVRRNFDLAATASRIEGLVIAARNTAVSTGVGAKIEVDPVVGSITASAFETVGEWSFEEFTGDTTLAAPNESAKLKGAIKCPGHIGNGILLSGGGYVDCGNNPRFSVQGGLHAEAWVLLEDGFGSEGSAPKRRRRRSASGPALQPRLQAQALLVKGDAFFFGVTSDGRLHGEVGSYRARTDPQSILSGRWTFVSVRFDGTQFQAAVDGIERELIPLGYETVDPKDYPPLPPAIPLDPSPLTIGSAMSSSTLCVDEVRLRGMTEPMVYEVPPNQLILGWKKLIWFDRRGHLDPRFHNRPQRLVVVELSPEAEPKKGKTEVVIDFSLTFQEWLRLNGRELEGLRQEDEEAGLLAKYAGRRTAEVTIDRIGTVR